MLKLYEKLLQISILIFDLTYQMIYFINKSLK